MLLVKPIINFVLILVVFYGGNIFASDYPKSQLEKDRDEIGSVMGGEGVVFRPGKAKSEATRATIGNINKYLFQASLEILKFAPLASADTKSGTVVTDWYSSQGQKNTQFKVTVYIKDENISAEGLEVIVFERKKTKTGWSESYKSAAVANVLENKIIRKARDLYLQFGK